MIFTRRFINFSLHQYRKREEIINYLIVGVLTTVVSLLSYYILVFTILNPNNAIQLQLANIISWILAVLFAYITNRMFVFESKVKGFVPTLKEMCSFFKVYPFQK